MRPFGFWLLVFAACAEDHHATLAQPLGLGTPVVVAGPPGAALGAGLARCATGEVVASAPGLPGTWTLDAGLTTLPGDAGAWTSVACVTSSNGQPWLAVGGKDGILRRPAGTQGWTSLAGGPFTTLAGGRAGAALLAGRESSMVSRFHADTASPLAPDLSGEGPVDSLAWFQDGQGLLVGSSTVSGVSVWKLDAGVPTYTESLYMLGHFGRAVASGDVSPRAGLERVISSDGEVWIIDQLGTTITVLRRGGDFGAALALGPSPYPGLEALWVSEPSSGKIWMFVGDAGVEATPPGASTLDGLGASLAFSGGTLYVGAPLAPPGGALVLTLVSIPTAADFELRECAPSSCARTGCAGICVGGVVCDFDRCLPDAGVGDAGVGDAGVVDAGVGDAGVGDAGVGDAGVIDAGVGDAGVVDAGVIDAGGTDAGGSDAGPTGKGPPDGGEAKGPDAGAADEPVTFSSTGCSVAPGLLSIATLLAIRRKRGLVGARPATRST